MLNLKPLVPMAVLAILAAGATPALGATCEPGEKLAPAGLSSKGKANLQAVTSWPGGAAEHTAHVDARRNIVRARPGEAAWVRLSRKLMNPRPVDTTPEEHAAWSPKWDWDAAPRRTTCLELRNGVIIGAPRPRQLSVYKLTVPRKKFRGRLFVSYIDVEDEDRDGRTNDRVRRPLGVLVVRPRKTQPQANSSGDAIDIVAMVDTSRSMDRNDPDGNREDAVDLLLRSADPGRGDRVGVVGFGSAARTLLPLTKVTGPRQAKALSGTVSRRLESSEGTNLDSAFSEGVDLLAKGGNLGRRKLGVLLTDGAHNTPWRQYQNGHHTFTHAFETAYPSGRTGRRSWPVCAVQLGNKVTSRDTNRLRRIASTTGGRYLKVTANNSLSDVVDRCRSIVSCDRTISSAKWTSVRPRRTRTLRTTIAGGRKWASFRATGINARHTIAVTAPGENGRVYTSDSIRRSGSRSARFATGRRWSLIEVRDPSPGTWTITVRAGDSGRSDTITARATQQQCGSRIFTVN